MRIPCVKLKILCGLSKINRMKLEENLKLKVNLLRYVLNKGYCTNQGIKNNLFENFSSYPL